MRTQLQYESRLLGGLKCIYASTFLSSVSQYPGHHLLCISLKKSLNKILCSVGDVPKILLWKI